MMIMLMEIWAGGIQLNYYVESRIPISVPGPISALNRYGTVPVSYRTMCRHGWIGMPIFLFF